MPITKNPPVGGMELISLTPFTRDSTGITGTNAYQTILSINGRGFLESFYATQAVANAGFAIRITADGVVKVLLGSSAALRAIGIVNKNDILTSASAGSNGPKTPGGFLGMANGVTGFKTYPTTDGTDGIIFLGDAKIAFNISLLLEISCPSATTYSYHYNGGYQ